VGIGSRYSGLANYKFSSASLQGRTILYPVRVGPGLDWVGGVITTVGDTPSTRVLLLLLVLVDSIGFTIFLGVDAFCNTLVFVS
jgi:hypothetical protein